MLTLGDVKCQYLVGLDMEEVGIKLIKITLLVQEVDPKVYQTGI